MQPLSALCALLLALVAPSWATTNGRGIVYEIHDVPDKGEAIATAQSYPVGVGVGVGGLGLGYGGGLGGAGLGSYYPVAAYGGLGGVAGVGGVGGVGVGGVGGLGGVGGGGFASGKALNSYGGGGYAGGLSGGGGLAQSGGYAAGGGKKGEAGALSSVAFSGGQGARAVNKADQGFYGGAAGGLNNYNQGGAFQHGLARGQQALTAGAVKAGGGHRKGHSSKGFQNYHHKDESGQTSTFFDEASDEGDHFKYTGQQGGFGVQDGSQYGGKLEDARFAAEQAARKGGFGHGFAVDDASGHKGSRGQQAFYGGEQGYGQSAAYDDFGKKVAQQGQQFGGQHGASYGQGFSKGGYGGVGGYY
ncbi:uncharacterized protein LOC126272085 [Schistocerca gregaria]|uniref:uncharacterized protein LOC126272085 n=1 Tax=Schistocerca gregaria TaxID=7010 RepID=UPI00211F217A|nr:uncharacterized protein LOC126272085 [Schistocerca gregaria]